MTKVIVFGTFDVIHPGHLHFLNAAKEYGEYLTVVIARDATVCTIKGRPPKNNEEVRLKNVIALNIANQVRLGCLDDKYRAIAEEKPDIVALGYDQRVFVGNLEDAVDSHVRIVKIPPFHPEIYKSSLVK